MSVFAKHVDFKLTVSGYSDWVRCTITRGPHHAALFFIRDTGSLKRAAINEFQVRRNTFGIMPVTLDFKLREINEPVAKNTKGVGRKAGTAVNDYETQDQNQTPEPSETDW